MGKFLNYIQKNEVEPLRQSILKKRPDLEKYLDEVISTESDPDILVVKLKNILYNSNFPNRVETYNSFQDNPYTDNQNQQWNVYGY